jgi:hypothetical protein
MVSAFDTPNRRISTQFPTHLHRQIHWRIRHAVLKVVREQDLDRLSPQLRFRILNILRHIRLTLPMENIDKLSPRQFFPIWQGGPNEVLELRKLRGDVNDPFTLLGLNGRRHALPEIRHRVDDVGAFESALQTFGIVEVRLDEFDALVGEFLAFGRCRVSG